MEIFETEPLTETALVKVSAATEQLSRRQELRQEIAHLGARMEKQDIAAAVIIGLLASIPATPYDNEAAQWFAAQTGIELPAHQGGNSVAKAGLSVLKQVQSGGVPDLRKIASVGGEEQSPMLQTLMNNAAQGGVIQAETVAQGLASMFDFEDVLGLGLGKVLTKMYADKVGLKPDTIRYHEFMALSHGVQAVVSAYWNFNPFVMGLALWHLGKCIWLGNVNVDQYVQLTEEALAEGRAALAAWEKSLADSRWTDDLVGRELGLAVPTMMELSDSDGFGD